MKTAFFDIETNSLLKDVSKFWVGVIKHNNDFTLYYTADDLISALSQYDVIVGHNCLMYDIPALKKLGSIDPYGLKCKIFDTCVMSRLLWPDRSTHVAGGSSLEAWGNYLKMPKGSHSDFSCLTSEMIDYCKQDVNITEKIFNTLIQASSQYPEAMAIEHSTSRIIGQQVLNGFGFDYHAACNLMAELQTKKAEVTEELQLAFPPKEIQLKTKVRSIPFNPGSRDMIASALIKKYKWKPKQFTETGKPQIDESVLEGLQYQETGLLISYLTIDKRIGQLRQWLDAAVETNTGYSVHGDVNTNGAVSGRMTHSNPNMAQVPRCGSPYGSECRSLFCPTQSTWVQVGADASGLELRMFAHYLAYYDNGAYAKVVCEGDIHTHNQKAANLKTRDQAKTFIYGLLYGAGDEKVGKIVDGTKADGASLKASFKKQVPAYSKLLNTLEYKVASSKQLNGLDGRPLPVRSAHSALNLLLQSAGAVVMKKALYLMDNELSSLYPNRYRFMANIHDEVQIECPEDIANHVGQIAISSITKAGEVLNLRCPLKGEFKIGRNWKETH